jgi:glycerol dehydrogenase
MIYRKFGAPRLYVQGEGALDELPILLGQYGNRPLFVADAIVSDLLGDRLRALFGDGIPIMANFGGECTSAEIVRISSMARENNADVIVGLGGGKAIDTAKGVRIALDLPVVICPTIASNDSPTSRLAVVYTEDHTISEVRLMPANPDAVLVDTGLIARAPVRFLIAGIGDALSKLFEVSQCAAVGGNNFYGGSPTRMALGISQTCYDTIRAHGAAAVADVRARQVSPALDDVVEACILHSGLAFESGGLSIAHSLTRGFSAVPALARALHGEQVAVGLLAQLMLSDGEHDRLRDLLNFYREIGLPRALSALGASADDHYEIARISLETAPYIGNFERSLAAKEISDALDDLETLEVG